MGVIFQPETSTSNNNAAVAGFVLNDFWVDVRTQDLLLVGGLINTESTSDSLTQAVIFRTSVTEPCTGLLQNRPDNWYKVLTPNSG